MSRRPSAIVTLTLGLVVWFAGTASAQQSTAWPAALAIAPATTAFAGTNYPVFNAQQIQRAVAAPDYRQSRPSPLMTSLYASTAVMQALDMHSTLSAFRAGAREVNPLMQDVTRNRAAFLAVKAGVAASTILAARQVSKRNKMAAVATLVAINSAYAIVVAHNYRVARGVN